MDINQLIQAFTDALKQVLISFSFWLPDQFALAAQGVLGAFIGWLKSTNYITSTPNNLVNTLQNYIGLNQIFPLLNAAVNTAILFAAVEYIGHYFFGWPAIGYKLQMIGVAIVLVKLSVQLTDWSIQLADSLTTGIAVNLPDVPHLDGANPIMLTILIAIWVILFARVAFVAAKRIAWLALLKPIAGLAFLTLLHQKTRWIAGMWVELWVGWLVGQFLAVLAIAATVLFINVGGFGGYILSCGALMVAHDAMQILTPKSGPPLISLGPVKLG